MAFASAVKAALPVLVLGLLLDGCFGLVITGDSSRSRHGTGPSTGSTASGGGTTTGAATGTAGAASTGGSSSAGSTGGVASNSTTSSSSGTTGGLLLDGGACVPGPGSNLQNEQGYFRAEGTNAIGNSADLNGDGLLDMIVQIGGPPGVTVLFGLPDGTLGSPNFYPDEGIADGPIVAGDVDGDGQPDVLYASWKGIQILANAGGTLKTLGSPVATTEIISALAVGDLNQDGIADILEGENAASDYVVNVFLGDGDGGFAAAVPVASLSSKQGQINRVATAFLSDLNMDGFPDIVAVAYDGSEVGVVLHEADGGYQTTLYYFPDPVTVVALPREGAAADLLVGYDTTVQVLINAGDGTFSSGPIYTVPNPLDALTISDFNGDCIPDIAVGSAGCPVLGPFVLFGNTDGGFGDPQVLPAGALGRFAILGPTVSPHALVADGECEDLALVVYGDASRH